MWKSESETRNGFQWKSQELYVVSSANIQQIRISTNQQRQLG